MAFGVVAAGCGDDDEPTTDAGADGGTGNDAGGNDAGGNDAGTDSGEEAACADVEGIDEEGCITVDGEQCCAFQLVTGTICPCVFPKGDTEVCGVDADDIRAVNPSSQFEGCVEADAPGVESDAAGVFFDRTGSDDKTELDIDFNDPDVEACDRDFSGEQEDGKFNIYSDVLGGLSYNGCCTESGQFGVNLSASNEFSNVNAHLGCKGFADLQSSLGSGDGNEEPCVDEKDAIDERDDRNAGVLPYCDPETGDAGCPPVMTALCAQLPGLSPQAFPVVCEGPEATPLWVCATIFMETVDPADLGAEYADGCVPLLSDSATSCPVDGDGVPQPDGTCIPVAGAPELPGCVSAD